jgi:hypothetical protein
MATYGEQMLRRAEAKVRARAARRRRITLLVPATFATLWSLADLLGARHARLAAIDAGMFRTGIDHLEPIVWTFAFVIVPILLAIKPNPTPQGAALALVAGPVLTPIVFGPGGWHLWQDAILFAVCAMILLAARARTRTTLAPQ